MLIAFAVSRLLFQSTQPKRAATVLIFPTTSGGIKFQSTQPKRAATRRVFPKIGDKYISIHAAQEGCDTSSAATLRLSL